MNDPTAAALADALTAYDRVVEVGVGTNHAVARRLVARGLAVTATDVEPQPVPDGVTFVVDDVTDPDLPVYLDAEAIYGLNLPPELHGPTKTLAGRVGADLLFTTLGGDPPTVEARPEQVPGDVLYRVE